jgi:hypothetical protein
VPDNSPDDFYVVDDINSEDDHSPTHIWLLIFVVVALSSLMVAYGLYSSNQRETDLANTLGSQFHGVLAEQDWQRIYSESDPAFKDKYSEESAIAMFSSVSIHLGAPATSTVIAKHMKRAQEGSFLYATFETSFTNEQRAVEHITWHETDGIFKLSDYDIVPEGK